MIMEVKMQDMSFKSMQETNGGYELPEVVIIGHRKTWWESLKEGIQNVDRYMMYLNRF